MAGFTPDQEQATRRLYEVLTNDTTLFDIASSLTCEEADTIADWVQAMGGSAKTFVEEHARGDDEGDLHWALRHQLERQDVGTSFGL